MTRVLLGGLALAGVYLLVLTSLAPGDVATAVVLGLGVAFALRPRTAATSLSLRPGAVPGLLWETAVEMVREAGAWSGSA